MIPRNAFSAANTTFIILFILYSYRLQFLLLFFFYLKEDFSWILNIQHYSAIFSFSLFFFVLYEISANYHHFVHTFLSCMSKVECFRLPFSYDCYLLQFILFSISFIRLILISSLMAIRTSPQRTNDLKNERLAIAITITVRECIFSGRVDYDRWFSLFLENNFEIGPYLKLRQNRFS